jgi:hypothetical protein
MNLLAASENVRNYYKALVSKNTHSGGDKYILTDGFRFLVVHEYYASSNPDEYVFKCFIRNGEIHVSFVS